MFFLCCWISCVVSIFFWFLAWRACGPKAGDSEGVFTNDLVSVKNTPKEDKRRKLAWFSRWRKETKQTLNNRETTIWLCWTRRNDKKLRRRLRWLFEVKVMRWLTPDVPDAPQSKVGQAHLQHDPVLWLNSRNGETNPNKTLRFQFVDSFPVSRFVREVPSWFYASWSPWLVSPVSG